MPHEKRKNNFIVAEKKEQNLGREKKYDVIVAETKEQTLDDFCCVSESFFSTLRASTRFFLAVPRFVRTRSFTPT